VVTRPVVVALLVVVGARRPVRRPVATDLPVVLRLRVDPPAVVGVRRQARVGLLVTGLPAVRHPAPAPADLRAMARLAALRLLVDLLATDLLAMDLPVGLQVVVCHLVMCLRASLLVVRLRAVRVAMAPLAVRRVGAMGRLERNLRQAAATAALPAMARPAALRPVAVLPAGAGHPPAASCRRSTAHRTRPVADPSVAPPQPGRRQKRSVLVGTR